MVQCIRRDKEHKVPISHVHKSGRKERFCVSYRVSQCQRVCMLRAKRCC